MQQLLQLHRASGLQLHLSTLLTYGLRPEHPPLAQWQFPKPSRATWHAKCLAVKEELINFATNYLQIWQQIVLDTERNKEGTLTTSSWSIRCCLLNILRPDSHWV